MGSSYKFSICLSIVVIIFVIIQTDLINGFSFDGTTVLCKGVNVTGYPKIKDQYQKCNASTYADFKKRGQSTAGYEPILCTAMCLFIEDKLIDTKTGKLSKNSLKDYDDMFNKMPDLVKGGIKKIFYDCFDTNINDTIYNSTNPTNCNGIMRVGGCIKFGVDGYCNPEAPEEDEDDEE